MISHNFTADNIEMVKFKTGTISNDPISKESYGSFTFYKCLMNSFKFIQCFLPKQSKSSLLFTCNMLFKCNNRNGCTFAIGKSKTYICKILENTGPLRGECLLFIPLGSNENRVLLTYFYIFLHIFCSGRAFK